MILTKVIRMKLQIQTNAQIPAKIRILVLISNLLFLLDILSALMFKVDIIIIFREILLKKMDKVRKCSFMCPENQRSP